MKYIKLAFVLSILSIWGCATPSFQSVPQGLQNKTDVSLVRSELLDQTNGTLMHLNDNKDVLYQQNFGGGGAAVGILLGPIGVAANAVAIESNTKRDVELLFGKTSIDPNKVFREIVLDAGFIIQDSGSASASFSPYILVSKGENEVLYFASALLVEENSASKKRWVGRYMYQIPQNMRKEDLADGLTDEERQDIRNSLKMGFVKLLSVYRKDSQGLLPAKSEITFKSEFVSPRFNFDLLGELVDDDPDKVSIRSTGALFVLPKKYVTIAYK